MKDPLPVVDLALAAGEVLDDLVEERAQTVLELVERIGGSDGGINMYRPAKIRAVPMLFSRRCLTVTPTS